MADDLQIKVAVDVSELSKLTASSAQVTSATEAMGESAKRTAEDARGLSERFLAEGFSASHATSALTNHRTEILETRLATDLLTGNVGRAEQAFACILGGHERRSISARCGAGSLGGGRRVHGGACI